ncbi:DegT/DnrJ/EryC1/StrS family aminotransferase [Brenneria uluponensis]
MLIKGRIKRAYEKAVRNAIGVDHITAAPSATISLMLALMVRNITGVHQS